MLSVNSLWLNFRSNSAPLPALPSDGGAVFCPNLLRASAERPGTGRGRGRNVYRLRYPVELAPSSRWGLSSELKSKEKNKMASLAAGLLSAAFLDI